MELKGANYGELSVAVMATVAAETPKLSLPSMRNARRARAWGGGRRGGAGAESNRRRARWLGQKGGVKVRGGANGERGSYCALARRANRKEPGEKASCYCVLASTRSGRGHPGARGERRRTPATTRRP
jgi:hypothetical protein